ncbi:MAG: alpha/beta hydrolase [Devosiaceae bacterium]|nr:alpha/beta hydrolase [Devosiaceae bacterium]
MPDKDFTKLPVPELPSPRYVGQGYFSIAYYVFEPASDSIAVIEPAPVEEFAPEEEPDYFEEHGYPEPELKPESGSEKAPVYEKTIVLCHGLAAGALQFAEDARFFAKQGFRVIVPDLRGHGLSKISNVKNFSSEDFTIKVMATDLIAILDKEQIKSTHWVGNSLGGLLAVSILGSNPGRIADLVVFGTSFTMDAPSLLLPLLKIIGKLAGRDRHDRQMARFTSPSPYARAIIYRMAKTSNRDCVYMIAQNLANYDLVDNAVNSDSAILMLRGQNDATINQALKITLLEMKNKPNFFLRDIANAGHCANLDQPEIVREAILDFVGGGWIFFE